MFDFVILHGPLLGDDLLQQQSQLGDVPLPASQLIKRPADDIADIEPERRTEGAARGDQSQASVENQQRVAYGVDNSLSDRSGSIGLNEASRLPEFIPDTSQVRSYARISGRSDSLSMSFDADCLGNNIHYDPTSDSLIIKNLPPALKARLLKHLQNNN